MKLYSKEYSKLVKKIQKEVKSWPKWKREYSISVYSNSYSKRF